MLIGNSYFVLHVCTVYVHTCVKCFVQINITELVLKFALEWIWMKYQFTTIPLIQ